MKPQDLLRLSLLLTFLLSACGGPATPTPVAFATAAPAATEAPAFSDAGGAAQLAYVPPATGMVIKDANLEMIVDDVDIALTQITQLTTDNGGYIISSQTWLVGESKNATLQLGVPSLRFESMLNTLRTLAVQVVKETTSGQDVSAEYTDLRSRLTNLEATAARVRDFLKDAKTVEESLHINAELSNLEGQIEQVKGQMKYYEGRAAFSTVTLTLRQKDAPIAPAAWNPGSTANRAASVLVKFVQFVADLMIWLVIVAGPFVLGLGLLVGAVWVARRLSRGKRTA